MESVAGLAADSLALHVVASGRLSAEQSARVAALATVVDVGADVAAKAKDAIPVEAKVAFGDALAEDADADASVRVLRRAEDVEKTAMLRVVVVVDRLADAINQLEAAIAADLANAVAARARVDAKVALFADSSAVVGVGLQVERRALTSDAVEARVAAAESALASRARSVAVGERAAISNRTTVVHVVRDRLARLRDGVPSVAREAGRCALASDANTGATIRVRGSALLANDTAVLDIGVGIGKDALAVGSLDVAGVASGRALTVDALGESIGRRADIAAATAVQAKNARQQVNRHVQALSSHSPVVDVVPDVTAVTKRVPVEARVACGHALSSFAASVLTVGVRRGANSGRVAAVVHVGHGVNPLTGRR